jgi:PKHD-type hydroxylase
MANRPIGARAPQTRTLAPFVETEACFTDEELARIVADGLALPLAKGRVTAAERAPEARNSTVALFPPEGRYAWMVERIARVAGELNRQAWGFDIVGTERLQFSAYGPSEHYHWHMDLGARGGFALRKISISVLLNDGADYEGGDLEVSLGTTNKMAGRKKGTVTVFPSYALHRVLPITRGTRYSLVAWIVGSEPFR